MRLNLARKFAAVMILVPALAVVGRAQTSAPTSPTAVAPTTMPVAAPTDIATSAPTTAPAAALDPEVDKILTRLEGREVRDLRAKLKWVLNYEIEADEEPDTKLGTIWYKQSEPSPKFKVKFDTKLAGSRKRDLDEEHLFDGRWYVEMQSQTKTITRREIYRPDEKVNPYKLGEGAFPLPFGQKKADILAEFDVGRIEPKSDDPPDTDHLRLIPRPDTNTGRTYKTLDFWIARTGHLSGLPLKVVAGKKDGTGAVNSRIEISFTDVELNPGLAEGVFVINTPAGYEEVVERLEEVAAPPPQP